MPSLGGALQLLLGLLLYLPDPLTAEIELLPHCLQRHGRVGIDTEAEPDNYLFPLREVFEKLDDFFVEGFEQQLMIDGSGVLSLHDVPDDDDGLAVSVTTVK